MTTWAAAFTVSENISGNCHYRDLAIWYAYSAAAAAAATGGDGSAVAQRVTFAYLNMACQLQADDADLYMRRQRSTGLDHRGLIVSGRPRDGTTRGAGAAPRCAKLSSFQHVARAFFPT